MILAKFIKPKWQHRNPDIRKSAIENLNDLTILSDVAQHDEAAIVRRTAVQKIEDLNLLEKIVQQDTDSTVREVAKQRFKKLLCGQKEGAPNLENRLNWLTKVTDHELLEYVAVHGQESELRLAAMQKIDRDSVLGDIAMNDPSSDIRLAAIDKISQPAILERVFKATRNRDKRVNRIARDKLDAMVAQQEQTQQVHTECETICVRLEALGRNHAWEQDLAEAKRLQERWQAVAADANHDLQTRFTKSLQVFQAAFDNYQQALQASHLRTQAALATKQQLYSQAEGLLAELQSLDRLGNAEDELFTQRLTTLQTQWQTNQVLQDQGEEQQWQRRFEQLHHHLQNRLQALRTHHQVATALESIIGQAETLLNSTEPLTPPLLDDLQTRWQEISQPTPTVALVDHLNSRFDHLLTTLQKRLRQQKERGEQVVQTFRQLLSDLEVALEHGELKTAMPLEQQARDLLTNAVGLAGHKKLETRLQKSTSKINQLRGWCSWGNKLERENLCQQLEDLLEGDDDHPEETLRLTQKVQEAWKKLGPVGYSQDLKERFQTACQTLYQRYREYLCRQVEGLLEQDADQPDEHARVIREAQATWKQLGSLGHTQALWERFNKASNTAYEPCQTYFNLQAQERQQHLQEKEAICERLENEQPDWEHPAWKEIYQFCRQQEHDWKNSGPIDRKTRKTIQKRYHKALQPWKDRLKEERQRGFEYRQRLIKQVDEVAEKLAQEADLEAAIAEVQKLQKQWYVAIPGSRQEERELWKDFRQACDKVFDHRRLQQEAVQQEFQANLAQKIALCEQVEAMANLTGEDLKAAPSQVKKLQEAFKKIGSVPKKTGDAIEKRLETAHKQVEVQRQAQLVAEQRSQLDLLREKVALCTFLEKGQVNSDRVATIQASWETLPKLDNSNLETAIIQRFAQALAGGPSRLNEEVLKTKNTLCVRMEILAGVESPPDGVGARMAYQVARLSEAMSGGEKVIIKNKLAEAQEIERSWYLSGAVPGELADRLEQRFSRAWEAFYARSSK
jgi:hypothetical protein